MRVTQLIADINKEVGGPSNSVPAIAKYLNKTIDIELACFKNDIQDKSYVKSFKSNNPFYFSYELYKYLIFRSNEDNIIHSHGLWLYTNIVPYFIKQKKDVKLVLSPRGTLSQWALNKSKIKKKIVYNLMFQKKALKSIDCFHATSKIEYDEIRNFGYRQPVAIIPNGIEKQKIIYNKSNHVSFFGRINDKKGIELLINAFSDVSNKLDFGLKIFGIKEDENYYNKIKKMIKNNSRIKLMDPVYGEDKIKSYQESIFTLMPSFSENFGNIVLESLINGTPALSTKYAAWDKLEIKNCGFLCLPTEDSIKEKLLKINSLDKSDLKIMNENSINYAQTFLWENISLDYINLYKWLNNESSKPKFIFD